MPKKTQTKKSKPEVLKPVDKSNFSLLHPENLKIALFMGGLILLLILPFIGIIVLVALLINHFRKK